MTWFKTQRNWILGSSVDNLHPISQHLVDTLRPKKQWGFIV